MKLPKNIALVLGSGAARGIAHIGILRALHEKGITIDSIAGTSMGAVVGAAYAKQRDFLALEKVVLDLNWKRLAALVDPGIYSLRDGLMNGDRVMETIHTIIGDVEFQDLDVPFFCMATDLQTGREVILDQGRVIDAVRASISLPGLFSPVRYHETFLMDGGVVNPLPVLNMRKRYDGFIVAVDVSMDYETLSKKKIAVSKQSASASSVLGASYLESINKKLDNYIAENKSSLKPIIDLSKQIQKNVRELTKRLTHPPPSAISVLIKTIFIMEHSIAQACAGHADVLIVPDVSHVELLEFHRAREAIDAGYKALG